MSLSRGRTGTNNPEVSLFPFLAVLLCTMGILIMLLVLIGQNTAQQQEETALSIPSEEAMPDEEPSVPAPADSPITEEELFALNESETTPLNQVESNQVEAVPTEEPSAMATPVEEDQPHQQEYEEALATFDGAELEQLESEIEQADWFKQELESVRDKTSEALRVNRENLSATESEIAKMLSRLTELRAQIAALEEDNPENPDIETLLAEIEQKKSTIASLTAEIEQLKQKNAEDAGKKSYAILPYKGKSGTFRRPIYIECHAHGICMMPENIPFVPEDFLLAAYPGNPFDAAVRAARQYFIEIGEGSEEAEPYPLLIVRPGGANQYYAAREALASWGGVCGYEFVEEGADIEYPAPDTELTRRVEEQIILARTQLAIPLATLIAAQQQSGGIGGSGGNSGSVSTGNGESPLANQLGPYARLESGSGTSGVLAQSESNPPTGNISSGYPTGTGTGPHEMVPSVGTNPPSSADPNDIPLPNYSGIYAGNTNIGNTNAGNTNTRNTNAGNRIDENSDFASSGSMSSGSMSSGQAGNNSSNSESSNPYQQATVGESYASSGAMNFLGSTAETSATNGQTSSIDPRQTLGNTAYDQTTSTGRTPSVDSESAASAPSKIREIKDPKDQPPPTVKTSPLDPKAFNLNEQLRKQHNVAMERPITIQCLPDRIVFPTQGGINAPIEIPISAETNSEILRTIVSTVQSWKVAGRNRYWSPWIQASVAPGAEQTYQGLEQLMQAQQVRMERIK